jgi:6-phosphogluconate dehydrogenase
MGGNLALQALEKGIKVVGFELKKTRPEFLGEGLVEIQSYEGFRKNLSSPKAIFVYIPSGPAFDRVLDETASSLERGDFWLMGEILTGAIRSDAIEGSKRRHPPARAAA